jgi:hypothetical protein
MVAVEQKSHSQQTAINRFKVISYAQPGKRDPVCQSVFEQLDGCRSQILGNII